MILLKNLWQKDGVGLTEEDRSANSMFEDRYGRYDDRKTDLRPSLIGLPSSYLPSNIELAKGKFDLFKEVVGVVGGVLAKIFSFVLFC
jgi:hypothetical protein